MRTGAVVALTLIAGCKFTPPTPVAYVQRGPAYGHPVTCGRTTMGCRPGYKLAVASATRMAIEFGGYTLIDGERINAELQRRTALTTETATDVTTTTVVAGRTWHDLGEQQQRDLLTAMGIRGTVHATISIGVPHGMAAQRTVTVAVAVERLSDEQVVWQSECSVETGDYHSEPQAIDLATRCALESGTLW